jgi:hypothetical protein
LDFASALEHAAALRAKVSALENALQRNPSNEGLRITLLSTKRMADRAEDELNAASETAQVDLCRYRLVQKASLPFAASKFAKSITFYQDLFTALVDRFFTGVAKNAAKYNDDIKQISELNVAYTYPGSLGVLFSITNQRDLFGRGRLDDVVSAFDALAALKTPEDVRGLASQLGLNVIRSTFKWADHNWNSQYSLDLGWTKHGYRSKGQYISNDDFFTIKKSIDYTAESETKLLTTEGFLVGYHSIRKTFSILPEGLSQPISGYLSREFPSDVEYTMNTKYHAIIKTKTEVNYSTEEERYTHKLMALKGI